MVSSSSSSSSSSSRSPRTSLTNPGQVASLSGARSSGWYKVGDGRWYGTVLRHDGKELIVEELAIGWRSTPNVSGAMSTTKRTLQLLLDAALKEEL